MLHHTTRTTGGMAIGHTIGTRHLTWRISATSAAAASSLIANNTRPLLSLPSLSLSLPLPSLAIVSLRTHTRRSYTYTSHLNHSNTWPLAHHRIAPPLPLPLSKVCSTSSNCNTQCVRSLSSMSKQSSSSPSSASSSSSTNTSTSINTSGDVPSSGSPPRRSFATWSTTKTDNFSRSSGTGTGSDSPTQQQQPPQQQSMSPQGQQDASGNNTTTTGGGEGGMTTRDRTTSTTMGGMGRMNATSDIPSSSGVHESIWQTSYPLSSSHLPSFGALTNNITTDVVIVGAGISGLTTAYELTRRGRDVVVVDGMTCIGGGETGRTSAHLVSYLDDGVAELTRRHGVEKTRAILESHAQAIDTIEAISKRHNINCDFARVDGFLFPKDAMKEGQGMDNEIKREWDAIGQCKVFAQAELVDRVTSIEGVNTGKAIRFPNQAQFHPTKYLYGLAKVLTEQKKR